MPNNQQFIGIVLFATLSRLHLSLSMQLSKYIGLNIYKSKI